MQTDEHAVAARLFTAGAGECCSVCGDTLETEARWFPQFHHELTFFDSLAGYVRCAATGAHPCCVQCAWQLRPKPDAVALECPVCRQALPVSRATLHLMKEMTARQTRADTWAENLHHEMLHERERASRYRRQASRVVRSYRALHDYTQRLWGNYETMRDLMRKAQDRQMQQVRDNSKRNRVQRRARDVRRIEDAADAAARRTAFAAAEEVLHDECARDSFSDATRYHDAAAAEELPPTDSLLSSL